MYTYAFEMAQCIVKPTASTSFGGFGQPLSCHPCRMLERLIVMHGSRPKLPQPTDKLDVGQNRRPRGPQMWMSSVVLTIQLLGYLILTHTQLKFAVSVGKNRTGRMLYDAFTVSGFRAFCTLRYLRWKKLLEASKRNWSTAWSDFSWHTQIFIPSHVSGVCPPKVMLCWSPQKLAWLWSANWGTAKPKPP